MHECGKMKVKTTDLQVGDVILFADMREKVTAIEYDENPDVRMAIIRVVRDFGENDDRAPVVDWYGSGMSAEHEVERNV